jgi:hypothetical protein
MASGSEVPTEPAAGYRRLANRASSEKKTGGLEIAIKLHRCGLTFLKDNWHPCWRVQNALDEQGIEYEVVKAPAIPRGRRKEVQRLTGQTLLPAIEFEDGNAYREESSAMEAKIRRGELLAGRD